MDRHAGRVYMNGYAFGTCNVVHEWIGMWDVYTLMDRHVMCVGING